MRGKWKVILKKTANIHCPRFGEIAVEMGYITPEQLKEALSEQVDNHFTYKPYKLIGEIFIHKGWMTMKQIEIVLYRCLRYEKLRETISKRGKDDLKVTA